MKRIISEHTFYAETAIKLSYKYRYYDTVLLEIIIEAVKNTINDFYGEIKPLEEIHRHIIENYI